VPLIEDDHMVEQIPAAVAHPATTNRNSPRPLAASLSVLPASHLITQ
jgi:hypothetical protein